MNRLTNHDPGRRLVACRANYESWNAIYDRLAAYEDTGLEPEELTIVRALCEDYVSAGLDAGFIRACINAVQSGMSTERITEITKAEAEGRLIILPCKVGDTVWFCFNEKVQSGTINRITTHTTRNDIFIALEVKFILPDPFYKDGRTTELRKFCSLVEHVAYERAYLTREEAEAALGGDGDG